MISFNDIKPGKLFVIRTTRRCVIQITSPLQELKTIFNVDIIGEDIYQNNSKYRNFWGQNIYFKKKELVKNNNYLPYWRKPRINEIFDWYILKFENEMYTQEQNP